MSRSDEREREREDADGVFRPPPTVSGAVREHTAPAHCPPRGFPISMRHHPHLSTVRLLIETLPAALRQTFWQKQRDPHQSNGIQTRVCISKNARKLGSTARLREKEQRRKRRDKRGETREKRAERAHSSVYSQRPLQS